MKKENNDKLAKDFPLLYVDMYGSLYKTGLSFGIECADGWYNIVYDLSKKLEEIIKAIPDTHCLCGDAKQMHQNETGNCKTLHPVEDDGFSAGVLEINCFCNTYISDRPRMAQCKEKFGTLRVYMSSYSDEIDAEIDKAEELSAKTCEICGNDGILRGCHWLHTICDDCEIKEISKNITTETNT